jgi:hypothetical protein
MQPIPVETLATNADVIVHGRVVSKTVQRDPEGRIYTRVKLEITEVWKGSVKPEEFSIVHGGGRLGDEESRASIQVNYEIGEEVVVMLQLNQRREGVTIGLVQGKFQVATEQKTGQKLVSNPFHGRSKEEPSARGTTGENRDRLTLEELKRRATGGNAQ